MLTPRSRIELISNSKGKNPIMILNIVLTGIVMSPTVMSPPKLLKLFTSAIRKPANPNLITPIMMRPNGVFQTLDILLIYLPPILLPFKQDKYNTKRYDDVKHKPR